MSPKELNQIAEQLNMTEAQVQQMRSAFIKASEASDKLAESMYAVMPWHGKVWYRLKKFFKELDFLKKYS